MTDPIDPDSLHDPRDAAAYWFARAQSGRMDEAERQRFEAWQQARPEHALEYRRAQGIWNALRLIPPERLRALAQDPAPAQQRKPPLRRPRFAFGLGLACTAAVVAGIGVSQYGLGMPDYAAEFATQVGERRQVTLPDGSIIDLNTATELTIRFYEGRRVVALGAGEAAFSVAQSTGQPFYVEAGETLVRVTGTRFDVRKDGERARVAVESGSVEVKSGPWWERSKVALGAGQVALPLAQGGMSVQDNADVAAMTAWKQGRVVFRKTPLPTALAEINRYTATPIRLGDASLSGIHIAGVFSTDDISSFLGMLPDIAPVEVRRLPDGAWVVQRR